MNLKIISAGAGSGKTYRLTQEMVALLKSGVRPSGIIATTFTNKAAAELQERVRVKLLEEGQSEAANELTNALIGTVHSLGVKLLRRFAFEAGVSPEVDIIADEDQQLLFNLSLANILTPERVNRMQELCDRLGLGKSSYRQEEYDWRHEVKMLTDTARANAFGIDILEKSREQSFATFQPFLGPIASLAPEDFNQRLNALLEQAIERLEANADSTKVTATALADLQQLRERLRRGQELFWHEWVKIGKVKVGAKSRDDVAALIEFAKSHEGHPQFQGDIKDFIDGIFQLAIEALKEYELYKKQRGLIDYIDMEIQVKQLLDQEAVREVLRAELDLLMVDEFQDTNPIQLEIFLKLSKIAKHSIWVGDPKQSIYGFRGADPRLMQAIIVENGGIAPEDIQEYSWRSREDIVYATNAIFTKAFSDLPTEQIALKPKRKSIADDDSTNKSNEPLEVEDALIHWHFQLDGEGRMPGRPWMENCIANSIQSFIAAEKTIFDKEAGVYRKVRAGDIAVLCRSNHECAEIAQSLHRAGLKAAIARIGLLDTAEIKLILACLKYILNIKDSLSVAEILLLASERHIEDIIDDRLEFLSQLSDFQRDENWGHQDAYIQQLNDLRREVTELSSAEILNLIMEELDLRRIIASWGRVSQRLDNVDVLRKLALQYEEACNRLHTAASLGGYLLWLNELEAQERDSQGSGEGPDAVNVMTYHKSKGLEWPVVVCHSLEGTLRDRVWGVDIIPETEEVDFDNLLGNRWLRYWINPYSNQIKNTNLDMRLSESEAKRSAVQQARAEEARVLYVGITRARDYLVFPTRANPTKWLNRVFQEGNEKAQTLDSMGTETPWEWGGKYLQTQLENKFFSREFTYAQPEAEVLHFSGKKSGKQTFKKYLIDDVEETQVKDLVRLIGENYSTYGPAMAIAPDASHYQIGKALKALLTADHLALTQEQRREMALGLLERFEVIEHLEPMQALQWSSQFHSNLQERFSPIRIQRKFPVQLVYQEQLFDKIIDLVLETKEGLVLIQHSGDRKKSKKKYRQKAADLRAFLHFSKMACRRLFGQQRVQTYIHFVMDSSLVEVKTELEAVQTKLFT